MRGGKALVPPSSIQVSVCVSTKTADQQRALGAQCATALPQTLAAPKASVWQLEPSWHYAHAIIASAMSAPVSRLGVWAISLVADCQQHELCVVISWIRCEACGLHGMISRTVSASCTFKGSTRVLGGCLDEPLTAVFLCSIPCMAHAVIVV